MPNLPFAFCDFLPFMVHLAGHIPPNKVYERLLGNGPKNSICLIRHRQMQAFLPGTMEPKAAKFPAIYTIYNYLIIII
ncbi:hypothetical protein D1B31_11060 [Neobacillus notoginsengisoli]|uniref:Uncharacterized protein n=1 Tax=Neobacillus notoginsengisoli TaxID=1578198 RepID=A0A417YU76_9BACI|nr:hypothetical protein D1B31_11060 [Neobacillus notoginsengisoli]